MPAKIVPLENYLSFSSVLRNNMAELNNNSPNVHNVSNNNFVDLLYVFDNRPAPSNLNNLELNRLEVANRLESMHNILEDHMARSSRNEDEQANERTIKTRIENDKFNFKNFDHLKSESTNLKSNKSTNKLDKTDLMNKLILKEKNKIFSVAHLNSSNYKPNYGLSNSGFYNNGGLYNGSRFVGYQKSKGTCYAVEVELKYVDLENLYICGNLTINGLTEEYPTLTTYFDGEIISEKYPFLTRRYDADFLIDRKHWSKFSAFYQFSGAFIEENNDYSKIKDSQYIFMRW